MSRGVRWDQMRLTGAAKSGADAVLQFLGSTTRHLPPLLLVAALLASTLTPRSHHVSTPQHHGRATRLHTPQHAPPRAGGRSVALPLGSIDLREARLARSLRGDHAPSAAASLLAHAWTRGPPLT